MVKVTGVSLGRDRDALPYTKSWLPSKYFRSGLSFLLAIPLSPHAHTPWMNGGETEDSKTVPNWTLAESLPLNMICVPTETDGNWVDEGEVSGIS